MPFYKRQLCKAIILPGKAISQLSSGEFVPIYIHEKYNYWNEVKKAKTFTLANGFQINMETQSEEQAFTRLPSVTKSPWLQLTKIDYSHREDFGQIRAVHLPSYVIRVAAASKDWPNTWGLCSNETSSWWGQNKTCSSTSQYLWVSAHGSKFYERWCCIGKHSEMCSTKYTT